METQYVPIGLNTLFLLSTNGVNVIRRYTIPEGFIILSFFVDQVLFDTLAVRDTKDNEPYP